MQPLIAVRPWLAVLAAATTPTASGTSSQLTVRTQTGFYTGKYDQDFTDVRAFLNIPYGLSTAGKNRFLPPRPVPFSSAQFDATDYAPLCPQYVSGLPSVFNQQIPQYLSLWNYSGDFFGYNDFQSGQPAAFASEDCLRLAIWAPANATSASKLPVALFWTGGGYMSNGILVPAQLPPRWVSRTQAHIVVTINYRLNILGFPRAGGLEDQNPGLLDTRLSLEWVRDNIVHFGGDPARILLWGQSAGASAADHYQYTYWDDPIAHAVFAQSGNLFFGHPPPDPEYTNFTFVARNVGCDFPGDYTAELECMQHVDANALVAFMGHYRDNSSSVAREQPAIAFGVVNDEKRTFANIPERIAQGFVPKVPVIYSSTANEGGSLVRYPKNNTLAGPNQTLANAITFTLSACSGANLTMMRHQHGLKTYRYQYAGNWTNQDPLSWMGAFHSSDLSMLFGSYAYTGSGGPHPQVTVSDPAGSPFEVQTSETMQDYILAFMKDPVNGPPSMGWLPMDPSAPDGGSMLRFGAGGKAVQNVTGREVEAVCFGKGPYNPFP